VPAVKADSARTLTTLSYPIVKSLSAVFEKNQLKFFCLPCLSAVEKEEKNTKTVAEECKTGDNISKLLPPRHSP
jgi:hypothetical protein